MVYGHLTTSETPKFLSINKSLINIGEIESVIQEGDSIIIQTKSKQKYDIDCPSPQSFFDTQKAIHTILCGEDSSLTINNSSIAITRKDDGYEKA